MTSRFQTYFYWTIVLPLQPVWVVCYRPRVSSVSCSRNVQKSTAALRVVGVHTKFGAPQFLCRLCASISVYLLWYGDALEAISILKYKNEKIDEAEYDCAL